MTALRSWRAAQLEERLAWEEAWQKTGMLFTREDGSLIHPDAFSAWWSRHLHQSGLPKVRFHDLRHTHASLALQAGVPAKVVSERLGHATVAFTLDVYSHNHGGRQLDCSPTPLEMLPAVVDAVGDRAEVYVDGGILSGSDVVAAVAFGARAALVGRAYLYGLMAGGERGVQRAAEILREEVDGTLALLGVTRAADLRREHVRLRGT